MESDRAERGSNWQGREKKRKLKGSEVKKGKGREREKRKRRGDTERGMGRRREGNRKPVWKFTHVRWGGGIAQLRKQGIFRTRKSQCHGSQERSQKWF